MVSCCSYYIRSSPLIILNFRASRDAKQRDSKKWHPGPHLDQINDSLLHLETSFYRAVGTGGGGELPPHVFGNLLTLFEPGGCIKTTTQKVIPTYFHTFQGPFANAGVAMASQLSEGLLS